MISEIEAHNIAKGFLKEACDVLGLSIEDLQVRYMPSFKIIDDNEIPMIPIIPLGNDVIVNDAFIKQSLSNNSSTSVRQAMYCLAWHICHPGSSAKEQLTFATALSLVKGIQLQNDCVIKVLGEKSITDIIQKVFHLDCTIVYAQCTDSSYRYSLQLRKDNNAHQPTRKIRVKGDYYQSIKGTINNPFENVDEAAEYIKELETKEWEEDLYLQEIVNSHYYYEPPQGPFRISWASPFVAFYKNEFPNNGFLVNQIDSGRFSVKPNLYKRKFLFRGQSEYYERCYPSLFRKENKDYFLDDLIWSQELQSLVASHPLIQRIESGIELLHDRFVFEMNYGGLTQHYYNKSPFLDLTSDIESAKFFAVTDYLSEKDEYCITKKHGLGVLYYYAIEMPYAFRGGKGFALSTIGKQVFLRSGAQHGFLLRMDKGVNFNDLPQVRKVFFKHNLAISQRIFNESESGKIFFPKDALQSACCERLEVLKRNRIVSLKAVELNQKCNPRETINSLISKLRMKDIKVDFTLEPKFPEEYLSQDNIQTMWSDFCNDVYFYTPDCPLYQRAMRDLPLDLKKTSN